MLESIVLRMVERLGGPCALPLPALVSALLPEGAEELVASDALEPWAAELRSLGFLPATPPPWEGNQRAAAKPARVLLCAPTFSDEGLISTGARVLEGDPERSSRIDGRHERAVRRFLSGVAIGLRGEDLAIALLPWWALGESTQLGVVRGRLTGQGAVRRIVAFPDARGDPPELAAVVLQSVRSHRPSTVLVQSVRLQRARGGASEHARWEAHALPDETSRWDDAVSPAPVLVLRYLSDLVGRSVSLAELDRQLQDGGVDRNYVERILLQQPFVRALARCPHDVVVPLPDLAHQQEIADQLREGTADAYELACLLQHRDPRDGEPQGGPDSTERLARYMRRFIGLVPSLERWVGWVPNLARNGAEHPALVRTNRLYQAMAEAAAARADAAETGDIGSRVALLTSALARLDQRAAPSGMVERVLLEATRRSIARARLEAVGTATVQVRAVHAQTRLGQTRLHLAASNRGRTTLFDLRLVVGPLDRIDTGVVIVRVVEAGKSVHLNVEYASDRSGEQRVEVRWSARTILGEDVKGTLVLAVEVAAHAVDLRDVERLVLEHQWDQVRSLLEDTALALPARGILAALLALRDGDLSRAAASLVDGASGADTDDASTLALLCCLFGAPGAALEIAEDLWRREPTDGAAALLLGRLRAWHGNRSGAKAVLFRALEELTSEAHGVLTSILVAEGKTRDAEDQLRGVELTDSVRLALVPAWVAWGRTKDADAIVADVERFAQIDREEVAWVVLDLLRSGELSWARRLQIAWRPEPADLFGAWLDARICDAEGHQDRREELLRGMFGTGHDFAFEPVELPSEPLGVNPYVVGPAIKDPSGFFGRREELARIVAALSSPHQLGVVLLEGERRTGKTSILNRVVEQVPKDVLPVTLNLQKIGTLIEDRQVWRAIATEVGRALRLAPGERDRRADLRDYQGLEDLVDEVLGLGRWRALALLIDEFEVLDRAVEQGRAVGVVAQLRVLTQTRPVSAVIAGAHALARSRREYRSPLFGFGLRIRIAELDPLAAREAVTKPSAPELRWTDAAVQHVLDLSDRQPFYLQHVCYQVFEQRRARPIHRAISVTDVETAVGPTLEAAEEHLDGLIEALSPTARMVVRRVSYTAPLDTRGVDRELVVEDVARVGGVDPGEAATTLDELVERGILRDAGVRAVCIAVRLLHHRVAARHPWEVTP